MISHQSDAEDSLQLLSKLEKALAIYFFVEFLFRVWSAGTDARFQGWKGRKRFICQPMCLIDTVIISLAITVVLLVEYRYNGRFLEVLRFIQIVRFFHIDRQMISFTLLKNFVERSKFELISIYYISTMIFAMLAYLAFTLEGSTSDGGLIDDPGTFNMTIL